MAVQSLVFGAEASDGCPVVKHLSHSSLSDVRRTLEITRNRNSQKLTRHAYLVECRLREKSRQTHTPNDSLTVATCILMSYC